MCMCIKIKYSFPISLLLAPAAGVDAASLSPHEVLPREYSTIIHPVVHKSTRRWTWIGEGTALGSSSVQNSRSVR